jgi:tetrapyrrole methylase family protein / MazG family protein
MKEFDRLVEIVKQLRQPETGCPWDIKQTSQSLIPNFIEELYECIEAIENEDYGHLSEELGDLMLHIVMQCNIAEEHFSLEEMLRKINEKLIRRHPHVFGNETEKCAEKVKLNWEKIKQIEKKKTRTSAIDGIPFSMPKLIVAQRMQEKAASVGFDWPSVEPVMEKLEEEKQEFEEAFLANDIEEMQNELGDLLFTIVNLARKLGFDAESALNRTIRKFERRFKEVEKHYKKKQKNMHDSNLEQLDEVWEITKQGEKS